MTPEHKVMIIGLDGLTFDLIDPWIAQGKLPVLKRTMEAGVRGVLRSTVMPNSFPGWTSCTTGVNPGKHGIFQPLIKRDSGYGMHVVSSQAVQAKPIWTLLSERGKKAGVINVPCTYPPVEVDGFLIAGLLSPGLESHFVYPDTLKRKILGTVGGYTIDTRIDQDRQRVLDDLLRSMEQRLKVTCLLMDGYEWDFSMVVFTAPDRVQHYFWADMDTSDRHHDPKEAERFGDAILRVYQACDSSVGELLARISSDTSVLIVSDHGFGPREIVYLNVWLIERGLLRLRISPERATLEGLKAFLRSMRVFPLVRRVRSALRSGGQDWIRAKWGGKEVSEQRFIDQIDWSATKAWVSADNGIRVNLAGREPRGIVQPGPEYEALIDLLQTELRKLCFPNGTPVFDYITRREEAYRGPFTDKAPDLILRMKVSYPLGGVGEKLFKSTRDMTSGGHTMDGIFIAHGPGIRQGAEIKGAELMDIAPTALYIMGEPLTPEMDGKVLMDIFMDPDQAPPKREGSSFKKGISQESVYGEDEEAKVVERLRNLGYL